MRFRYRISTSHGQETIELLPVTQMYGPAVRRKRFR